MIHRATVLGAVAVTSLVLFAVAAVGARAEPSFARKTITISIGYTAGGSYDLYGRLVARHLGRHIAGQPTVPTSQPPISGATAAAAAPAAAQMPTARPRFSP